MTLSPEAVSRGGFSRRLEQRAFRGDCTAEYTGAFAQAQRDPPLFDDGVTQYPGSAEITWLFSGGDKAEFLVLIGSLTAL